MQNRTLEDTRIAFRNFAGKEGPFNPAGKRNFAVLLTEEEAKIFEKEGWNVKYLKTRDEGEVPQAFLKVAVSHDKRPPKIVLITSRGLTYLGKDDLDMLDWVDIDVVDVTLNPYEYDVNGSKGVKAYVSGLYIKIREDYLELKWQAWAEGQNQNALPAGSTADGDYIDGEYYEQHELEAA